jgi:hypothetical protein
LNAYRHLVLTPVALLLLGSCGTATRKDSEFAKPNSLMADEIRSRVDNINYLHREQLVDNLLWLAQSGEQAIPSLLDGLQSGAPKVRSNCAWVLGQIGDRRVIPHLQKLVTDSHETVRLEAARTLVVLGDMKHAPMLIEGLDSERVQVRYLCHEALKDSTGRDFGYNHVAEDVGQRQQAVLKWRQWWSQQAGDPWFAQQYATRHGLDGATGAGPVGTQPPSAPMGESAPGAERREPQLEARPQAEGSSPSSRPGSATGTDGSRATPESGASESSERPQGSERTEGTETGAPSSSSPSGAAPGRRGER